MYAPLPIIMATASILNFLMSISMAIDPDCDFYQDMIMGEEYYIYNQEYPSNYPSSTSCRWIGKSPQDTNIVLSCEVIDLPPSTNCQGDRLSISLTGDENFRDATNYCGQTALTVITENNYLAVGLFATNYSPGGRFVCALTAIQTGPITTTTPKPNICDCGWKHQTRIVGGHETGVNEYPLMAALLDATTGDAFCGASIISDRYALTAAHCLLNREMNYLGLLVGDHNLKTGNDTAAAALYALSGAMTHPYYNSTTQQHDICVVKTRLQIQFSFLVGPVCLPFRYTTEDFFSEVVTALGWGFLDFAGPKSNTLQEVDLSIISNTDCAASVPDPISLNQICTYAPNKDTCLSDSGGPILWHDPSTGKLHLVGIISFGIGCATSKPSVNTRVTSYLSWIASVTRDAVYCIK